MSRTDLRTSHHIRTLHRRYGFVLGGAAVSALLLWGGLSQSAPLTNPSDFSDGEIISASAMNSRFTELYDGHNDQESRLESLEASNDAPGVAVLRDHKANGTSGGQAVEDSWHTRDLIGPVEGFNADFISLGSNSFTLTTGTYWIEFTAPGYACDSHQARLFNVTSGSAAITGGNASNEPNAPTMTWSSGAGVVEVTGASATFRVEHWLQTSGGSGLGKPITGGTGEEIYTQVSIREL